ncbi:MAG: CAP domain-containing protein, partial [Pedobacter sp.]
YFSHTSPTYGSPFDMIKAEGVSYRYAGENIAGNSTASRAMTAWMQSEGHRANILNPNFTHIGLGVAYQASPYNIYVQEFTQEG